MQNSLSQIDRVYSCGVSPSFKRTLVFCAALQEFCNGLSSLDRALAESRSEDFWREFLRPLRLYRFFVSSTPLPFDHPFLCSDALMRQLKKHLVHCKHLYPSFEDKASSLVRQVQELSTIGTNPLLQELKTHVKKHQTALLIKDAVAIPAIEDYLAGFHEFNDLHIVSHHQLRTPRVFDNLIVFGPTRWFPPYVFSAPRAPKINVIVHSWVKDGWTSECAFLGNSSGTIHSQKRVQATSLPDPISDELFIDHEDWRRYGDRVLAQESHNPENELVEARLVLLEGTALVFLESADESKVLTIDPEEEAEESGEEEFVVKRVPVESLIPGDYVLLRTSGGGDFIKAIADRFLGESAAGLRASLASWKRRLHNEIESNGIRQVRLALRNLGSMKATEMNIRNWASDHSIKPHSREDFEPILRFVGLEKDAGQLWENACLIDSAHKRAGFYIRRLLLNKVRESDVTELMRLGRMEFQLEEAEGGAFTAYRVIQISPETYEVPATRIAKVLETREGMQKSLVL